MQVSLITNLFSQLGNPQSLLPLAVKDFVNSAGITYNAYQNGGEIEAKDRFIDEFGTQAIWLGGIPTLKWIVDKTLYKATGYSLAVDPRVISSKNPDYLKIALENAPAKEVADNIKQAVANKSTFKALFYTKFALATSLTLGAYHLMTKLKQQYTHENIEKAYKEKIVSNMKYDADPHPTFSSFKSVKPQSKTTPNFGSGSTASFFQSFMFDPVRNTSIIDLGIEGNRLSNSRNETETGELLIKAGGFLGIMYFAADKIDKSFEYVASKFFDMTLKLDAKFLASEELKDSLKKPGEIAKDLDAFNKNKSETDILKFIFKNQDNIVVKAAIYSKAIETYIDNNKVDTGKIDTGKYIDHKQLTEISSDIQKFLDSYKINGEGAVDSFVKKAKIVKFGSVIANITISCLALGVALPLILNKYREMTSGTTDFHVQKEVEAKLAKQGFCGLNVKG